MKRSVLLILAVCLILACCTGCGQKGVDPDIKPETYFSQYLVFTELYGMERMEALEALGVDLQDVDNISDNRWGIARTETYAGLEFEISALFKGQDNHFSGVYMERTYSFPEDEGVFIQDTVAVCKQLTEDFGEATDNSYFFNWVSVMIGEDWNRDIKFWQDPFVLKRVVDEEFGGNLLCWDLTPVAGDAVKRELGDARHGLSCSIHVSENNGTAVLMIFY